MPGLKNQEKQKRWAAEAKKRRRSENMKGQLNITNIMGVVVAVIFLAAIMPTLIMGQGLLQGTTTPLSVEWVLAGLIIVFVIIALLTHVGSMGETRVPQYY